MCKTYLCYIRPGQYNIPHLAFMGGADPGFIKFFPYPCNSLLSNDPMWQHRSRSTLPQVMACCCTKPLPEPMLTYHQRCSLASVMKDLQRSPWVGIMNTVRWEILFKTICSQKSFWEYVLINVVSTAPADGMALIGWIFVTSFILNLTPGLCIGLMVNYHWILQWRFT